ncbi:hypothetical protein BASA81_006531 [Batrachochytrium salamandrivorans]|nr:hypothetical protein BASA81_006531 [Batrachochytrium salamandrivorans]
MQQGFLVFYVAVLTGLGIADGWGLLHKSGMSMMDRFAKPPVAPAFQHPQTFHAEQSSIDMILFALLLLTPCMAMWRMFWKRIVFSRLADVCVGQGNTKVHAKFTEQAWLGWHFSLMFALELVVLSRKPWWPSWATGLSSEMYATVEQRLEDQQDFGLRCMYSIQLAFYTLELVTLVSRKESRTRSDASLYLFHHIYTVLLLMGSWLLLCHRFGSLILIIHDVGDVFLPVGKCFSYSESKVKRTCSNNVLALLQFAGTGVFATFVVMFVVPRIMLFGTVLYQTGFELGWTVCCGTFSPETLECTLMCPSLFYMKGLMALLLLLWPMQMFWMLLIFKMAAKVLTGLHQDVRSDDEEEVVESSPIKTKDV